MERLASSAKERHMTTTAVKHNTMTWQPSIVTTSEHEYIVESLRQATGMLHNLAATFFQDFEDLYQEAYVEALHIVRSMPKDVRKPRAYMHRALRFHLLGLLTAKPKEASLDAPLSEEGNETLLDLLAQQPVIEDHSEAHNERDQALYAALKRLPLEEQQFFCEVFELNAFEPVPLYPYSLNNAHRSRNAARQGAYRWLRRDQALAAAVGVQA